MLPLHAGRPNLSVGGYHVEVGRASSEIAIKLTKIPDDLTRNPQYISREYIVDDDKISTKALRPWNSFYMEIMRCCWHKGKRHRKCDLLAHYEAP